MKCLSGFLALCILTPVFSWIHRCPPAEDLAPLCTCVRTTSISRDVLINCNRLDHAHALSEQLSALKNYEVDLLVIENSGPLDMVDDLFRNLSIRSLRFTDSTFGIFSLFSLNGIQHSLAFLFIEKCNITRWVSSGIQFSFLQRIDYIYVNLNPILIPADFANYPSRVKELRIEACKITRLEKLALRKFDSLTDLSLSSNRLNSISRNSLAPYLPQLKTLVLSKNPLETLSNDMFKQMPRLKLLSLDYTNLKILHQEIFLPVWNQLIFVDFSGVSLNSDCNNTWLLSINWKKKGGYSPSCLGFKKRIDESSYRELCPE